MKQMAKRVVAFLLAFGLVAMTGPMSALQVNAYAAPAQETICLSEAEAPAEETPAEETPAEETPAEETPAEETPAEETPAEEPPAEETPAEETPAEETPAEEPPAEETPAEETPAEETPAAVPAEEPELNEAAAGGVVYYVNADKGSDSNAGTVDSPLKTFKAALQKVAAGSEDATVVLMTSVDAQLGTWNTYGGNTITFTSNDGTTDYGETAGAQMYLSSDAEGQNYRLGGDTIFSDLTIKTQLYQRFSISGYDFTVEEDVVCVPKDPDSCR